MPSSLPVPCPKVDEQRKMTLKSQASSLDISYPAPIHNDDPVSYDQVPKSEEGLPGYCRGTFSYTPAEKHVRPDISCVSRFSSATQGEGEAVHDHQNPKQAHCNAPLRYSVVPPFEHVTRSTTHDSRTTALFVVAGISTLLLISGVILTISFSHDARFKDAVISS